MTKEETEANKIIEMYNDLTDECDCLEYLCICFSMYEAKSKQCALIHVNGIIEATTKGLLIVDKSVYDWQVKQKDYWQRVKEIIQKR